jgi:hypothetical protein
MAALGRPRSARSRTQAPPIPAPWPSPSAFNPTLDASRREPATHPRLASDADDLPANIGKTRHVRACVFISIDAQRVHCGCSSVGDADVTVVAYVGVAFCGPVPVADAGAGGNARDFPLAFLVTASPPTPEKTVAYPADRLSSNYSPRKARFPLHRDHEKDLRITASPERQTD